MSVDVSDVPDDAPLGPEIRDLAPDLALRPLDRAEDGRADLGRAGADRWEGPGGPDGGRTFGGLLVAQALAAAWATVTDDRRPHALHSSFLRTGVGGEPVVHEVERTRDGRSFSTRRVVSAQSGGEVLVTNVDFHVDEPGPDYQVPPGPPLPDAGSGLPVGRYHNWWFESRDVPAGHPGRLPHARAAWYRARGAMPDDPRLHLLALAMMSDHGPTRAAREPHLDAVDVERRFSVSLDHSVWFHRPARLDRWVCSEFVPISTGGGRGLTFGTVRSADGTVLASVAQESTLRFG